MDMRTLLQTADLDRATLDGLLAVARSLRSEVDSGHRPLAGRTLCVAFLAESTRTRVCLEDAAARLGVELRDMTAAALSLGRGPTAAVEWSAAARASDALAIRHSRAPGRAQALLAEMAQASGRPIINLQSESDHPIQTLSDLLTLQDAQGGDLSGVTVAITWAWQRRPEWPASVPRGLVSLLPRFGVRVRIASPPGFELPSGVIERARALAEHESGGGDLTHCATMDAALSGADFVYPQCWVPSELQHRPDEAASLAAPFADWVVDERRLDRMSPKAGVLRSLPPSPGEEMSERLLHPPRGLFFEQAANRLAVTRAVLMRAIPAAPVEGCDR